jgi:seryl-tRNA synthetase
MNLKSYLNNKFGKNLFSLNQNDLLRERVKNEKNVERLSEDIKAIQERIQKLMLDSKGQPKTLKLLNVQKIKSLRLEAATKQQEASRYLRELQLLLLIEAMHEQKKFERESDFVDRIMNTDVEQLTSLITDMDVKKAIEEGRLDLVKSRLSKIYGREEMPVDEESHDIMRAIDDLEKVDEETAFKMAGEKARILAEENPRKKPVMEEKED